MLVAAAAVVLVTGTVVTGTGPHGGDADVDRLPFDITDVARVHSVCAWMFLALAGVGRWWRCAAAAPRVRSTGGRSVLVGAIVVQGAIGYTQYFTGVPPWLVLLHVLGSTLVWIAVAAVRPRPDRPSGRGPGPPDCELMDLSPDPARAAGD